MNDMVAGRTYNLVQILFYTAKFDMRERTLRFPWNQMG